MIAKLLVGEKARIAAFKGMRDSGFSLVRLHLYSQSGVPVFLEITRTGWIDSPVNREIVQDGRGVVLGTDVDYKFYTGEATDQNVYYWLEGICDG